jgi:hypothetical protein
VEAEELGEDFLWYFLRLSFEISLVRLYFLGTGLGGGELAACRHCADSGRELGKMYAAIVYIG